MPRPDIVAAVSTLLPPAASRKQAKLRARLLGGVVKSLIILAVVGIVTFATAALEEAKQSSYNAINNEVNQLKSDVSNIQKKLDQAGKMLPDYKQLIAEQGNAKIPLDRDLAQKQIEKLQSDFLFNSLHFTINPIVELKEQTYKNTFSKASMCDMSLSFEALTDEDVMNFMRRLRHSLAGHALQMTSINMARTGSGASSISKMAGEIMRSGKVSLIKADVKLQWMGMDDVQAAATKKDIPAAKP